MNGPASAALIAIPLLLFSAAPAGAQATYRPTPPPAVSAEIEDWYLAREPLPHGGHVYYPAGPQIHFIPHEMVRVGVHRGIPLYTRTTLEPMSVVFVPVGRGVMQPYERRREGDLAGTVGSQAPSFPVGRPEEAVATTGTDYGARILFGTEGEPPAQPDTEPSTARPTERIPRPLGPTDGIFIMFEQRRWYSTGAVKLPASTLTRVGEHHGVPIYRRRGDSAIYVPVDRKDGERLARFERR